MGFELGPWLLSADEDEKVESGYFSRICQCQLANG